MARVPRPRPRESGAGDSATTPGLAETLARDSRKAARFYSRFGITEAMFRHGVPRGDRGIRST